jgi:hypothetical protein
MPEQGFKTGACCAACSRDGNPQRQRLRLHGTASSWRPRGRPSRHFGDL